LHCTAIVRDINPVCWLATGHSTAQHSTELCCAVLAVLWWLWCSCAVLCGRLALLAVLSGCAACRPCAIAYCTNRPNWVRSADCDELPYSYSCTCSECVRASHTVHDMSSGGVQRQRAAAGRRVASVVITLPSQPHDCEQCASEWQ
jgi:hypothetical protein